MPARTGISRRRPTSSPVARNRPAGVPLGAQLSKRVSSGAITSAQAQQTAKQRQTLAKAYGPDWRTKVFGAGGVKGISGPFASGQVAAKRSSALARAGGGLSKAKAIPAKKGKPLGIQPSSGKNDRQYLSAGMTTSSAPHRKRAPGWFHDGGTKWRNSNTSYMLGEGNPGTEGLPGSATLEGAIRRYTRNHPGQAATRSSRIKALRRELRKLREREAQKNNPAGSGPSLA